MKISAGPPPRSISGLAAGIGISRFCIFTEATHGIPKAVIGIGICLLAALYHMVMALHIDGEDEGAEEK